MTRRTWFTIVLGNLLAAFGFALAVTTGGKAELGADNALTHASSCPVCRRAALGWDDRSASMSGENLAKIDPALCTARDCAPPKRAEAKEFTCAWSGLTSLFEQASGWEANETRRGLELGGASARRSAGLAARQARGAGPLECDGPGPFRSLVRPASQAARETIVKRIAILQQLNERYKVENFRRANPPRPGIFAYVFSTDPTRVFLDMAFVNAPPIGVNSRAGTITHEMSHFRIAGGTKDHAYGPVAARELARKNGARAMENADNFEYFVETNPVRR